MSTPKTSELTPEPLIFLGQIVQSFPRDVTDSLWKQGVDLDDWDYAILAPTESIFQRENEDGFYPLEWTLEKMLTGCCDNRWYRATIRRQEFAIGIAYHA